MECVRSPTTCMIFCRNVQIMFDKMRPDTVCTRSRNAIHIMVFDTDQKYGHICNGCVCTRYSRCTFAGSICIVDITEKKGNKNEIEVNVCRCHHQPTCCMHRGIILTTAAQPRRHIRNGTDTQHNFISEKGSLQKKNAPSL